MMIWHGVYFVLICTSAALIYASHKNQLWLTKPLAIKPWRYIAFSLQLVALGGELAVFTTTSAIFGWLAMNMLVFTCMPFLSLFKRTH